MSPHQYLHASLLLLLQSRDTLVAAARAVTDGDTRLAILPDPTRGTYALRTLRCGERPRKTAVVTPTGAAATEAALDEALVAWVVSRLAALPRDNGAAPRTRAASGAVLEALVAWTGAGLQPARPNEGGAPGTGPAPRRRRRGKRGGRKRQRRVLDIETARALLLDRYGFVEERPGHYRRPLAASAEAR